MGISHDIRYLKEVRKGTRQVLISFLTFGESRIISIKNRYIRKSLKHKFSPTCFRIERTGMVSLRCERRRGGEGPDGS